MSKKVKEAKTETSQENKTVDEAPEVKKESLWKQFKKFISKGNILDMAVGVIIGGAFNAIVNSLVKILLSVCTWAVPGGIDGLVTVLPAISESQKGMNEAIGLGQTFDKSQLTNLAIELGKTINPGQTEFSISEITSLESKITSDYSLYGNLYVYNNSTMIDWGAFINAVIYFLIIALTLFVIVKVYKKLEEKRIHYTKKLETQLSHTVGKIEEQIAPKNSDKSPENTSKTE